MKFYDSTTTPGNYAIKGAAVSRQSKSRQQTVVSSALVTFTRQCLLRRDVGETRRGLSEHVRFKREKSASHGRSLHKNVEFRLHSALIPFACLLNAAFVFSPRLPLFFSLSLSLASSLFRSHSARACGVYNLCNDFHSVTIRRRRQIPRGASRDQTLLS